MVRSKVNRGLLSVAWIVLAVSTSLCADKNDTNNAYYDARERYSASLTFEWVAEAQVKMERAFYEQINLAKLEQARRMGISPDLVDAEKSAEKTYNTNCHYFVVRSGKRSMITLSEQNINLVHSEADYQTTIFYQSGNQVLYLSIDKEAKIQSADLLKFIDVGNASSIFGLDVPNAPRPPLDSSVLIFYMGFSPLRLFGVALKDWELAEVSPEEWVFRLRGGTVRQVKQAIVRLSRPHGDAPKVIEIEYADGRKHVLRTQRFAIYFGEWFAAEVEELFQNSYQSALTRHVLQRVVRTSPDHLRLEIPNDTPIRVWTIGRDAEGNAEVQDTTTQKWNDHFIADPE